MPTHILRLPGFLGAVVFLLSGHPLPAGAASPSIPETLSYQGVLLDDLGQPRTGTVDLTLRVWDTPIFGSLLYTQIFLATPLTDGVFSVELGPTGAATDTPNDPLTTSLSDALVGDLGVTGPTRFLEVTAGAGGAMGRIQILTVPYAMRAGSAASADTAAAVSGVPGAFVSELFEHGNADGSGPTNADPSEGIADPDLDGIANFIDPDNDDDGLSDTAEVSQGSDINQVTPTLTGFVPTTADGSFASTVTIQGTNFEPGMSIAFGAQTPTPTNVTPSSLDVEVGPAPSGPASVTVTRINGESDSGSFPFFLVGPVITGFSPPDLSAFFGPTTVTVLGTDFVPGMTVSFGFESPTPQNVTATSFDVVVGPQGPSVVEVVVTRPNGESDTALFEFNAPGGDDHGVTLNARTQLSLAISGNQRTLVSGIAEYGIDTDLDGIPDTTIPFATRVSNEVGATAPGQLAVAWSPSGDLVGLRCCDIELLTDSNADFDLEDETPVTVDSFLTGFSRLWSPSLAFDTSGPSPKVVAGFVRLDFSGTAKVAHDRDGDGLFTGTNERVTLDSGLNSAGTASNLGEVAVDASGRVAYVYHRKTSTDDDIRVAYDRSGDGDFDDSPSGNPELATLATGRPACLGTAFDPNGDLAVIYALPGSDPVLAIDADGDGRFSGPGETVTLPGGAATACDVTGGPVLGVAHNAGGILRMLIDRNGDGDFDDAAQFEDQVLLFAGGGVLEAEIATSPVGDVWVAADDQIWVDQATP